MNTIKNDNRSKSQGNFYANVVFVNIILLGILLAFVAPTLYSLHKGSHISYEPNTRIQWSQPSALSKTFSTPVTNHNWRIDFVDLEKLLLKSESTDSGELYINANTLELLERAIALMPKNISPRESARIKFLTSRSIPGIRGTQLGEMLMQYHLYDQDYRSSIATINQAPPKQQLSLLKAHAQSLRIRQDKDFGPEVAFQLFDKKNVTTDYLNQRRIVTSTNELTAAQKKEKLSALKENYKALLEVRGRE